MNQDKEGIEEIVKNGYKQLGRIEDIENRLEQIEKTKIIYSYLVPYLGEQKIQYYYVNSKFEALIEKSKRDFFEQKEDFNAFHSISNKKELDELMNCLTEAVIKQGMRMLYKMTEAGDKQKQAKQLIQIMEDIIKNRNRKIKLPSIRKNNILLADDLLAMYILAEVKENLYENKKYLAKIPFFNIHKLRLTKSQKEKFKDSVNLKILYAYLKQMAQDRNYSIEEVKNILIRFGIYNDRNIELLCKVHKLDRLLEILHTYDVAEGFHYINSLDLDKNREVKVRRPNHISTNLVKIKLIPNEYMEFKISLFTKEKKEEEEELETSFESGMETLKMFNSFANDAGEEIIGVAQEEKYEKISKELKELGIWNKLLYIDTANQHYIIAINLDDFANIPIDKSKLEKIEDKELQTEYLEGRIEELSNLIEFCIPDGEKEKLSLRMKLADIRKRIDSKYLQLQSIEEELKQLNELSEELIIYIEGLDVKRILDFGKEKLEQLDKDNDFEENIKEVQRINIINKYITEKIRVEGEFLVNLHFEDKCIIKKFEIICREILRRNISKLQKPTEEMILEQMVYPYCTKREQELFEKQIRKIVQEIIIKGNDRIPIQHDIIDIDLFGFPMNLKIARNKVLEEFRQNNTKDVVQLEKEVLELE